MKKLLLVCSVIALVACKKDRVLEDLPCRNCTYNLYYKNGGIYAGFTAAQMEHRLNTGEIVQDSSGLQFPPKIESGNTICNYLDTSKVLIRVDKNCIE